MHVAIEPETLFPSYHVKELMKPHLLLRSLQGSMYVRMVKITWDEGLGS